MWMSDSPTHTHGDPSHGPRFSARRSVRRALTAVLLCTATLAPLAPLHILGRGTAFAASDAVLYDEGLTAGWANWSWDSTVDVNGTPAYNSARAIQWRIDAAWGGLYLHTDQAVPAAGDTTLHFALRPSQDNARLAVVLFGPTNQILGSPRRLSEVGGDPAANTWTVYDIPLGSLGAAGQQITGVALQDFSGAPQALIAVDDVKLVGTAAPAGGGSTGTACGNIPAYPEIRPGNTVANQTMGRPADPAAFAGWAGFRPYYAQIDGACTGTTEQILEWAARKWGFDQLGYPDLAKAVAVVETWWAQSWVGANGEVGILQVRPVWPDWQEAQRSTAFAADYAMAVIRMHYDGASWLGDGTKGNLRNAVAAWECGCGGNGGGDYASRVFAYNDAKPWQRPGQPPDWF